MEQKDFAKHFIAGIFFIAGIALLVGFILTIGQDKGFAKTKFQTTVLFRNIGGLSDGAPVRLAGVNIGNVASISFVSQPVEGRRVQLVLNIYSEFRNQFYQNLHFSIRTQGILGEQYVEIEVIEGGAAIDITKPVIGEDPLNVQDIAEAFGGAAQSFTNTSEKLGEIDMQELSQVMSESSKALLVTSEGLNAMMGDLEIVVNKARRVMDRLEQKLIEGNLFKVF